MNQYGTLITNIGLAKMANAQITQTKVKVTHIAIGDGNGGEYVPEPTQTSLVNEVWRGNVGNVTIDSENDKRIIADVAVPANVGGFTIREVGLFDEEGDLIAVSPFPPKYKPALEEGIADDMLIHFTIETANASSISLEIDPNIIVATRKYVDEKVNKVANDLGTVEQTVNAHKAEYESLITNNPNAKNSIYRGKYLGDQVTPEQYQAISSGTFEDLYIGDYWTINGVNYRIAGFDYYYNTGDTECTTHHAVIVPDSYLYIHPMNDADTTEGGYVNCKMYTEGLAQALSTIKSAFSGHVLKHRQMLSNATSDGKASGFSWYDSEVELMNETMVYGTSVLGISSLGGGSGYNVGVDKSQLPLFALNPRMISIRQSYWLRDVASGSHFARAHDYGHADSGNASNAFGVRPVFSIS